MFRVVQKNLVFVIGLPPKLTDHEVLKKPEYFGRFGKILKVMVNTLNANGTPVCQIVNPTVTPTQYRLLNKVIVIIQKNDEGE